MNSRHFFVNGLEDRGSIPGRIIRKTQIMEQGAYDKFPGIFRMGTFIDSTHMKL